MHLAAPFTKMKLSQKSLELSKKTLSKKSLLMSALWKRVVATSRANKATTTKSSLTKLMIRMRLLSEDLKDPSAPKVALLISKTRDQLFQLLVAKKLPAALRSPDVPILHLSALAAPISLHAASLMLREFCARSLMRLALIDQVAPIFLPVSLLTQAVLKVPLALRSQAVLNANSPPELDLPSNVPDLASTVPPLVTNDLTNLSAHKLEVSVLRSQAVLASLNVPYPSVSDLMSQAPRANALAFLLDLLAVVPLLLVLLDALTARLSAFPIVAVKPLKAELVV